MRNQWKRSSTEVQKLYKNSKQKPQLSELKNIKEVLNRKNDKNINFNIELIKKA